MNEIVACLTTVRTKSLGVSKIKAYVQSLEKNELVESYVGGDKNCCN